MVRARFSVALVNLQGTRVGGAEKGVCRGAGNRGKGSGGTEGVWGMGLKGVARGQDVCFEGKGKLVGSRTRR